MQTLIRLNLVILLSFLTLGVLVFLFFAGAGYWEIRKSATFFEKTTCATMLQDLKSQSPAKAQIYGEAFQSTASSGMQLVDEELHASQISFSKMLRGCFAQPEHTLRQILVGKTPDGIATEVTDLYNTIDGELKHPTPMATELYMTPATESVSSTQPQTSEVSATEVKGIDANTPFPASQTKTKATTKPATTKPE